MDAGMPVGGIRISREAGTTVRTASYLPTDCAVFCRFLSSRKVLPMLRLSPWHTASVVIGCPLLSRSCCQCTGSGAKHCSDRIVNIHYLLADPAHTMRHDMMVVPQDIHQNSKSRKCSSFL